MPQKKRIDWDKVNKGLEDIAGDFNESESCEVEPGIISKIDLISPLYVVRARVVNYKEDKSDSILLIRLSQNKYDNAVKDGYDGNKEDFDRERDWFYNDLIEDAKIYGLRLIGKPYQIGQTTVPGYDIVLSFNFISHEDYLLEEKEGEE